MLVSIARTVVPMVAGLVLTLAARVGLDLDEAEVTAAVGTALSAAYYTGLRGVEEWAGRAQHPQLRRVAGVLLGWARPPQYPAPAGRSLDVALANSRAGADR
ncbi:hypothetical protein [Streptomyces sp. NBRC 109706]|uniref:hypothetical protein n=1 Tax=Streptomyces sp. NBRC 109706 TaxID=1550035 RepID=UPI000782002B|nr:hypothetical protein [Streptomyces sp. NBRC 109706]